MVLSFFQQLFRRKPKANKPLTTRHMKKDIILIGKQGSGKGTQSKLLVQDYSYEIFETGGALRAIASSGSDLGKKVLEITQRGDLVSNEIVMDIVEDFLKNISSDTPVIFDGIPRSEEQRVSLEALLNKYNREFVVVELTLHNEIAIERMLGRGRQDDTPEAIKKRLENFDAYTAPLIDVWRKQDKVLTIDGDLNVEEGQKQLREVLGLN